MVGSAFLPQIIPTGLIFIEFSLQNYAILNCVHIYDILLHWDHIFLSTIRDNSNMGLAPNAPHIQTFLILIDIPREDLFYLLLATWSLLFNPRKMAVSQI